MNTDSKRKLKIGVVLGFLLVGLFFAWGIFVPKSFYSNATVSYLAQKGEGQNDIAKDLENQGVIGNGWFFKMYIFLTGNRSKLQAGLYQFSPSMSIAGIVNKLVTGDVVKNKIRVLEGWNNVTIAKHVESRGIYSASDMHAAMNTDFSKEFAFLKSKSNNVSLEGYLFPDTYVVPAITSPQEFMRIALNNFDKKLTLQLRKDIAAQKKTIFQIVTMASILEKEVPTLEDKKMVAGILWKRLQYGMPLQVDATINYVTGKNDVAARLIDKRIDSPYNTYKYKGLPKGPISNPGMDSILAAIYPTKNLYWFYLSAYGSGKTIYSKTYREHNIAIAKYQSS